MKTQSEMKAILLQYLTEKIPPVISAAGLPEINDFLGRVPTSADLKQLCVYTAEGKYLVDRADEAFIIRLQLPKYSEPDLYVSEIWPVLIAFDVTKISMIRGEYSHQEWYPGELPELGSSSSVIFEAVFYNELDDCD